MAPLFMTTLRCRFSFPALIFVFHVITASKENGITLFFGQADKSNLLFFASYAHFSGFIDDDSAFRKKWVM
ncbi:MAG: hypothetical protein FWC50_12540 [Planctomycetaceae bacterium]|nr:hypothetical protein [Planctomycetaceae bacterium]